jgi:hypothetical protein
VRAAAEPTPPANKQSPLAFPVTVMRSSGSKRAASPPHAPAPAALDLRPAALRGVPNLRAGAIDLAEQQAEYLAKAKDKIEALQQYARRVDSMRESMKENVQQGDGRATITLTDAARATVMNSCTSSS